MPNKYRNKKWKWFISKNYEITKRISRSKKGEWFPKKSSGILCKVTRLEQYIFIKLNSLKYGLRWLLRKFAISSNAYYNYLKHRKKDYEARKLNILKRIEEIYHQNHGNPGYRMMHDYLNLEGIYVSKSTIYRYMKEKQLLTKGNRFILREKLIKYLEI